MNPLFVVLFLLPLHQDSRASPLLNRNGFAYTETAECPRGDLLNYINCACCGPDGNTPTISCIVDKDCYILGKGAKCCYDRCGSRYCFRESKLITTRCHIKGDPALNEVPLQIYQPLEQFVWRCQRCICGYDGQPDNCTAVENCGGPPGDADVYDFLLERPLDQDDIVPSKIPPADTEVGKSAFIEKNIINFLYGREFKSADEDIEYSGDESAESGFDNQEEFVFSPP